MDDYLNIRTALLGKLYTKLENELDFNALAIEIFGFQYRFNPVYRSYVDLIGVHPSEVNKYDDIPFLPIQLFKSKTVKTGAWPSERIFNSSATTGQIPSKSHIRDLKHYENNTVNCFQKRFGSLKHFKWYGLLPNYLEQGNSSLVHMVHHFMQKYPDSEGGFFLHDYERMIDEIKKDGSGKQKVLIGVSFALLDMAENYKYDLSKAMIIETGGMKGRGREMPKEELHEILVNSFNVESIYSEYGMAELMSQAYSEGGEILYAAPTMRILISDLYDPFSYVEPGNQGRINIIDLANIDTCAFISTDDLGYSLDHMKFVVKGRTDSSEVRGCNILYTG